MVPSLAASISDVSLDAAAHRLDCEHYPRLRQLALAHTRASLGVASCLGNAVGVRMRCNSYRNHVVVPWKRTRARWRSVRLKSYSLSLWGSRQRPFNLKGGFDDKIELLFDDSVS